MRYAVYSLIIFAVFGGIFFYLLNSLSPWNVDAVNTAIERFGLLTNVEFHDFVKESVRDGSIFSLLNLKNLAILGVVGLVAVASAFSTIHFFVDKLFFKKFYEKPSVFNAVRRGVLLGLLAETFIMLRLLGSFELYIVAGCVVLVGLIEVLFVMVGKKEGRERKERKNENDEKPKELKVEGKTDTSGQ